MRAWQRMLSGRRLNLLDPSPIDIEIEDIAHGLARVARWNGQTIGDYAFSVAQHCVVVEQLAVQEQPGLPAAWRLAALLHDAPEYVIGDMISPFKGAIGSDYKRIEHALQEAIHIRFGLPPRLPADVARLIKRADKTAAFSEAVDLAGFGEAEARRILGYRRKARSARLTALPPGEAKQAFLERFCQLVSA
jgi:5'-deoxynucleotidase YfbR-like HD superfamily hydrolase